MDLAFSVEGYKDARTLVNNGNKVKLTVEDLVDYDRLFARKGMNEIYRRPPFEEIIEGIDDLRLFAKYVYRIGMTITKAEIVD